MLERSEVEGRKDALIPTGGDSNLWVKVLDGDEQAALAGARVEVAFLDSTGKWLTFQRSAGEEGNLRIPGMPAHAYQVTARKRGYFDCGPVNVVLPLDEAVTLSLLPAGLISGQVKSVTGGIPPRGLVIFLNTRTSVVVQAKGARDGRFTSPPLEGGEWRVDWTSDVKTPTDPRISTVLAVVPRQELVIEITAGRPGAEPRGRRKVGLTLVEE